MSKIRLSTRIAKRFDYTQAIEERLKRAEERLGICNDGFVRWREEAKQWRKYAADLEKIKGVRDLADLTKLAQAVIEYRRALSMLGAADPVDARHDVEAIFEKYNINLPERPFD